jgi:hypothetical protein
MEPLGEIQCNQLHKVVRHLFGLQLKLLASGIQAALADIAVVRGARSAKLERPFIHVTIITKRAVC